MAAARPAAGPPVLPVLRAPVHVRVPASSANLGPGFDAVGLALELYDDVVVEAVDGAAEVAVAGEGAGALPCDDSHLVVRAVHAAFDAAGVAHRGVRLRCRNEVPHGRGLGSSAAAVVAGLLAGQALSGGGGESVDVLALATRLEGHPDNAAAALLGGLTVAWLEGDAPRAVRLQPHPELRVVLAVPRRRLATSAARRLLPAAVPHVDAAFTAGRAALLVAAATSRPDLLLPATADRLHQAQRRPGMPESLDLVDALRARGEAAAISGAGPSVVVLTTDPAAARRVRALAGAAWEVRAVGIAGAATVERA